MIESHPEIARKNVDMVNRKLQLLAKPRRKHI